MSSFLPSRCLFLYAHILSGHISHPGRSAVWSDTRLQGCQHAYNINNTTNNNINANTSNNINSNTNSNTNINIEVAESYVLYNVMMTTRK